MSGVPHSDSGVGQAIDLVEECSKILDGQDFDSGVPIDVFIAALRGSQAKLASMRKIRSKR